MTDQEYIDVNKDLKPAATPVQPAAMPKGLSTKTVNTVVNNIVFILGAVVLLGMTFSFVSAWFEKPATEALIGFVGVALGYLGRLLTEGE